MPEENDLRPDPDQLLARVQQQEAAAGRGRLRIYFGASAGVGKTYAMLSAAQKARQDGLEVVVGIVETHGRDDTAALVAGLEILPLRQVAHRGQQFTEFDLDAALARRPALLLVDELAHSNAAGSRHPKRWQDVEELLESGIDVWTTLNVQHLESLNDVVGGITGIRVMETLPDGVFDEADEVVLVDIPADELLARLKAGKVYLAQHAERAAQNFFRKGNLMALREVALRRTADRVEDDVRTWRVEQSISQVWKTEGAILAGIGSSPGSEHVVRSAARFAGQINADWHAIYVETPRLQQLPNSERERILAVLKLAEQLQATTAVVAADDVAHALVDYARRHNLSRLLVGHQVGARRWPWQRPIADRVAALAPDLDLLRLGRTGQGAARPLHRGTGAPEPADTATEAREKAMPYVWATLACVAVTVAAAPLLPFFDLANIVMLFLLTVVVVGVRLGRGPAVLAAFVAVGSFDFFFVPPRFSFAVSDWQYLLTFGVMLAVALITGQLAAGLRFQARISTQREERSRALFEFARDLSAALQTEQVVETSTRVLERSFGGRTVLLLPDTAGRLKLPDPVAADIEAVDLGIAQWTLERGEQAGFATDTLPSNPWRYVPLRAPMRSRGVMAIRPASRRLLLIPEQRRQLEVFASLIAIALERVHFVDVAQEMLVKIESERLRSSLLAAVSHDLRTPLAGLIGLADALSISRPPLSGEQTHVAQAIRESAIRMNVLVGNLLDMARLQSGEVRLALGWQSVEEVVGSAIRAARPLLGARQVLTRIPADLPLAEFDAVLIERVLANLLENAGKYAPDAGPIEVSAAAEQQGLRVTVADRGPGIAPEILETIFEKFTRGGTESATAGVGLGLAICKAAVEAHGGRIWAENRPQGGAAFSFVLPLGTAPESQDRDAPEPGAPSGASPSGEAPAPEVIG